MCVCMDLNAHTKLLTHSVAAEKGRLWQVIYGACVWVHYIDRGCGGNGEEGKMGERQERALGSW